MSVTCHIEIEGVEFAAREPHVFQSCPRSGDLIGLAADWPHTVIVRFNVQSVLHVPDGEDSGRPSFTVLFVKREA
jgi:hypothetical protein